MNWLASSLHPSGSSSCPRSVYIPYMTVQMANGASMAAARRFKKFP
nr:hypothetical protein [Paenibacillus dendritiformis]